MCAARIVPEMSPNESKRVERSETECNGAKRKRVEKSGVRGRERAGQDLERRHVCGGAKEHKSTGSVLRVERPPTREEKKKGCAR